MRERSGRRTRKRRDSRTDVTGASLTRLSSVVTLQEACTAWLNSVAPTLREGTASDYEAILNRAIALIGPDRPVSAITADEVGAFTAQLRQRGLAPNSIRNYLRPLLAVLRARGQFADKVRVPQGNRTPRQHLTAEQARRLLKGAEGHWLEGPIRLALTAGLRAGEITALRWDAIDLAAATLRVRQTYRAGDEQHYAATAPKTRAGERTVPLIPETARYLAGLPRTDGYVFTRREGQPLSGGTFADATKRLCRKLGLPEVVFHALRHSCATLLLEAGVPAPQVATLLGHADVHVTLGVYAHVTHRMEQHAIATLTEVFAEPGNASRPVRVRRIARARTRRVEATIPGAKRKTINSDAGDKHGL